jgi:adenosylcobinamide-GDP ribazoletransferase
MEFSAIARLALDDITTCLAFYTRLPFSLNGQVRRSFAQAQWAAPVAGLVVGLFGGIAYVIAGLIGLPDFIAAIFGLGVTLLVTGCLHEDGLADVADGFGGGSGKERKLEIMKDSRIGTYGVAALVLTMLLRWSAIAALPSPGAAMAAFIAAHMASRALIPAFMQTVPPARESGLSASVGAIPPEAAQGALGIGVASLFLIGLPGALMAAAFLAIWFFLLRRLSEQQVGGQTGDVLGCLQQGAEIVVLLAACSFLK